MAEEANYEKLIAQYPSTFIAQQEGAFYHCYGESAYIIHGLLGFKLRLSKFKEVRVGFSIEKPERALMKLNDKHINFKFFCGNEEKEGAKFKDNKFDEYNKLFFGVDKPVEDNREYKNSKAEASTTSIQGNSLQEDTFKEENKRQHASVMEGMGDDLTRAMNDLLARIEKNILNKGMRVEAMSTVVEERNGAVRVMGMVFHDTK